MYLESRKKQNLKTDRQILHRDSIQIDVALAKKDKGTPILKAMRAQKVF